MSLLESLLAQLGLVSLYTEAQKLDIPVVNTLLALPPLESIDPALATQLVTALSAINVDPANPDPLAALTPVLAAALPVLLASGLLSGTDGSDILFSGIPGLGTLLATPGAASGKGGNDLVFGGNGLDVIDGGAGNDVIYGDTLVLSELLGLGDADILLGGDGNDKLFGQTGNDSLLGGNGNDSLYGGIGNDLLVDTAGNDLFDGGAGTDTAVFASTTTDLITVNLTTGVATGALIGTDKLVSIENVTIASVGGSVLTGSAVGNVLTGSLGADQISGQGGNDTLKGGFGADLLSGDAGSDLLVYGRTATLLDSSILGIDTVTGFDFGAGGDKFRFEGNAPTSVGTQTFTTNSNSALLLLGIPLNAANFAAGAAKLLTITGGNSAGTYLVVDGNNTAGYQFGADFIVRLVGSVNTASFDLADVQG